MRHFNLSNLVLIFAVYLEVTRSAVVEVSGVQFPNSFSVLGPFPSGDRERGADPSCFYGCIQSLVPNSNQKFWSELADGGLIGWRTFNTTDDGSTDISFSDIRWDFLGQVFGLAAVMWQGWAVGTISVDTPGTFNIACAGVSSFRIDNTTWPGDTYGTGRMVSSIPLTAGSHTLYVPVGDLEEDSFRCYTTGVVGAGSLEILDDVLVPDIVDGLLASPFVSLVVMNTGQEKLENFVVSVDPNPFFEILKTRPFGTLRPNQAQALDFSVMALAPLPSPASSACPVPMNVTLRAAPAGGVSASVVATKTVHLPCNTIANMYLFTFPDSDSSIQTAEVKVPARMCNSTAAGSCAILLSAHGAGLEVGSQAAAYAQQNLTWLVVPNGRGKYGFDWQGPAMQNAIDALHYVATNLPGIPTSLRSAYAADPYRVIFAGHSMGGHGAWELAVHYPDRALAVAPAAAWIKFQNYIPMYLRVGDAWADPYLRAILEASIADYDVDMLVGNIGGLDVQLRVGGADDDVNPWHLRRMARMAHEAHAASVNLSEIPNKGHWWWEDGNVIDDAVMQGFFNAHANSTYVPAMPVTWQLVSLNPVTTTGRGGFRILQFLIPYRIASMNVTRTDSATWLVTTSNVRRFQYRPRPSSGDIAPMELIVDGWRVPCMAAPDSQVCSFVRRDIKWSVEPDSSWQLTERGPSTYGPVVQVMSSAFLIVVGTTDASMTAVFEEVATGIANRWYSTGRGATAIVLDTQLVHDDLVRYNLILLGGPDANIATDRYTAQVPVRFSQHPDTRRNTVCVGPACYDSNSTGVIFLCPVKSPATFWTTALFPPKHAPSQPSHRDHCDWCHHTVTRDGDFLHAFRSKSNKPPRLAVVIGGNDEAGFRKAAGLLPIGTGLMVPDYMAVGPDWGWKGAGGVLAAGYWGNYWEFIREMGFVTAVDPSWEDSGPNWIVNTIRSRAWSFPAGMAVGFVSLVVIEVIGWVALRKLSLAEYLIQWRWRMAHWLKGYRRVTTEPDPDIPAGAIPLTDSPDNYDSGNPQ